jgi:hypothetical protein
VRAMTDPPKRPRPAKTVMNVRSAEGAFVTAIARRRSNLLRSRTSASGTFRTCGSGRYMSVIGGKADVPELDLDFRFWTRTGHQGGFRSPFQGASFSRYDGRSLSVGGRQ